MDLIVISIDVLQLSLLQIHPIAKYMIDLTNNLATINTSFRSFRLSLGFTAFTCVFEISSDELRYEGLSSFV